MADVKISGLPASTTPLAGTEVLPIVQGGQTRQVSVNNLTAGKAVTASSLTATNLKTSPATANLDISGTTIAAAGTDANVDVNINAKGTGVAYLNQRWGVNASGALVASANNTYDIGNGASDPRDISLGRNLFAGGSATAATFIPSSSTAPTNGLFLPAANSVGIATNSTLKASIDSNGQMGLGVVPKAWGTNFKAIELGTFGAVAGDNINGVSYQLSNAFGTAAGAFSYVNSNSAAAHQVGLGAHFFQVAPSGTAGNPISFTNAMYIANSGGVSIGNTTDAGATNLRITGNVVMATSGKGIDFSVTPDGSGTMTSELLADYEEGTWTPTLTTNGTDFTSVSYDAVTGGKYVKIGNVVYIQGVIRTSAVTVGSASGAVRIGGLPYAVSANTGSTANGNSAISLGLSVSWAADNPIAGLAVASTSQITLYYRATVGGGTLDLPAATGVATGASSNSLRFAGTYITS